MTAPPAFWVRQLFLRALGAVFACAFVSLWVQAEGLFGSRGIEPAAELIRWARQNLSFTSLPTVFWWSASDRALHLAFAVGVGASVAVMAGVAQRLALFLCWALYLSLVGVGGVFLRFQWDMLLLEAGLLGILFAPAGLLRVRRAPVNVPSLWLLRWLIFRLMFLSGMVKLLSGDPTWRNLTAFEYHYWTQPLPAWTSYYVAQLPLWMQKLSTVSTFVIELALPFLVFLPRRFRLTAFVAFVVLQLAIGLTGNYGFFNLLTAVLCLPLLDDTQVTRAVPERWRARLEPLLLGTAAREQPLPERRARTVATVVLAAVIVWVSTGEFFDRLGWVHEPSALRRWVAPLQSINSYGLFAVMTTEREEISVEGSTDGATWKEYVFKWKPGPLGRRPAFIGPHMPRLDWQMWFAALSACEQNPWFLAFLQRLAEGSPQVGALLERDPFEGIPPRYFRTPMAPYRFTSLKEKAETGNWWKRGEAHPYCPPLSFSR